MPMDIRTTRPTASCSAFVEIHLTRSILLVGPCTDPDISVLQKRFLQRRLSFQAIDQLHRGEHAAAARLRQIAFRLGTVSLSSCAADHAVVRTVVQAVDSGRASAVFLPDHIRNRQAGSLRPAPASAPPPTFQQRIPPRSPAVLKPRLDVARLTRIQRVEEMLKRVPNYLSGNLKASFLALLSPESLALLAASSVALAVAQAYGVGEAVDAGLAYLAYSIAGVQGLWALLDLLLALKDAVFATTEEEIDKAARLFAGAIVVLGISILTIGLLRVNRSGGEGESGAGSNASPSERPPTSPDPAQAGKPKQWKLGDDHNAPKPSGDKPSWSAIRSRFWKNEAAKPQNGTWSEEQLARMRGGLAPQRYNPAKGDMESMELSHEPIPSRDGGDRVVPRWPQDHAAVDPYRRPGY